MNAPCETGLALARIAVLVGLARLCFQPALARGGDAAAPSTPAPEAVVETMESRLYLAPGFQFGPSSQEITLSIGRAVVARREQSLGDGRIASGGWGAFGLRLSGVAQSWKPAAVHGFVYLSFGGGALDMFPVGFEFALGGGSGGSVGYGLVQLSAVIGIASRFEAFATLQWLVGENVARSEWVSPALFGLRYGLDLGKPRRQRVTRVEEDEQVQDAR